MNEEEMINRGTAAVELLNNPTFQSAAKELMDIYFNNIIQTAPIDEKSREAAYYQTRALQDIFAVLNQWVSAKDNILEARKASEDNSEEE